MNSPSPSSLKLVLCDHSGLGRITVPMESFFDFSFMMADELEDLVSQWREFARPQQCDSRRRSLRRD